MSAIVWDENDCDNCLSVRNHLKPSVEKRMASTIHLNPRTWESNHVKSSVNHFAKHAVIYYSRDLNPCWTRYVIAKEIAHLLHDETSKCQVSGDAESQELVDFITNPEVDFGESPGVDSEKVCEIYAIELLLPHAHRDQLGNISREQIAKTYRLPRAKVEVYFHPAYIKSCVLAKDLIDRSQPLPNDLQ